MNNSATNRDQAELRMRVLRYCRAHRLFEPGVTVVGVSGGVDSLTLLHILIALRTELNISLHVATLDHGLRGTAGEADADFVRETADEWGVPVSMGHADVSTLASEQGIGIEEAARQARYAFFADVAHKIGTRQVAVAHQRDDQVETTLMHVVRGAGASGLRGMLPVNERNGLRIVRPLLDVPRGLIEAYAAAHNLHPRWDATNADRLYTRNRVRLETLPTLRTLNPAIDEALTHTAELARAEYDALLWALQTHLVEWPLRAESSAFRALPLGLQRFAVHLIAPEWSFDQVEALVDWLMRGKPGEGRALPDGRTILLTFDQIMVESSPDQVVVTWPALPNGLGDEAIELSLPGHIELANGWHLSSAPVVGDGSQWDRPPWTDPLHTVLVVPPGATVTVRRCCPGDRFAPHGLAGHTQKLSDTLINLKVPAAWRTRLPLVMIDKEIAWFVAPTPHGFQGRVSEKFAWRARDSEAWHFWYERGEQKLLG